MTLIGVHWFGIPCAGLWDDRYVLSGHSRFAGWAAPDYAFAKCTVASCARYHRVRRSQGRRWTKVTNLSLFISFLRYWGVFCDVPFCQTNVVHHLIIPHISLLVGLHCCSCRHLCIPRWDFIKVALMCIIDCHQLTFRQFHDQVGVHDGGGLSFKCTFDTLVKSLCWKPAIFRRDWSWLHPEHPRSGTE